MIASTSFLKSFLSMNDKISNKFVSFSLHKSNITQKRAVSNHEAARFLYIRTSLLLRAHLKDARRKTIGALEDGQKRTAVLGGTDVPLLFRALESEVPR